jgi:hypothetical protein
MWADREFIAQVDAALKAEAQGVKSRYTHPDMSGDALAKGLGRMTLAESSSPDVVRADLHIWKSARNSPDGDMGAHVLERAAEDPASFGASISFFHDPQAETEFLLAHGATVDRNGWVDTSGFKSPDPDNINNLPHVRLAKLRAIDVVDDPAANPDGLFHRDETFQEAEALLAYVIGETKGPKPELVKLGVDPDRASGFIKRFLATRGLSIMKAKNIGRFAEGNTSEAAEETVAVAEAAGDVETPVAEVVASDEQEETEAHEPGNSNVVTTRVVAELGVDPRAEVKRYIAAFGAQGGEWYAEGLSFEQCFQKRLEQLSAENAGLRKRLELSQESEPSALSQGGADKPGKKRAGFSSKLKIQGVAQPQE